MSRTETPFERQDRLARDYGVCESGVPVGPEYHEQVSSETISLAEVAARRGRITRLRILSDLGSPYADVSYCHATLPSGEIVRVANAPIGIRYYRIKADLIAWAKQEHVYAKGIGLLDESMWSILR